MGVVESGKLKRKLETPETLPLHWSVSSGDMSFECALGYATRGEKPDPAWIVPLLACCATDVDALYAAADTVRSVSVGTDVHLRALLEFSNICRKNCAYCGLRRENSNVDRYRLRPDEIVASAREADRLGYRSVVLQSGEDAWFTDDRLAEVIRRIKAECDLAITLSVGERDESTYRKWREAGADRVLLRIETTDPSLFRFLHPDDDFDVRMQCLQTLKSLGYQLGSGVMVGLPGQTPLMLAKDVVWLHEIGAEMIGVGPFIPHPETPLKNEEGGTLEQTLRLVAVLRLVFPHAHIPATTAVGSLHPLGRERALKAGANVMMPNVTPMETRPKYQLYPGKICLGDDAAHCRECMGHRIAAIGRTIGTDQGHVHRVAQSKTTPRES